MREINKHAVLNLERKSKKETKVVSWVRSVKGRRTFCNPEEGKMGLKAFRYVFSKDLFLTVNLVPFNETACIKQIYESNNAIHIKSFFSDAYLHVLANPTITLNYNTK